MKKRQQKTIGFFLGSFFGTVAGFFVGVFTPPESAKNNRQKQLEKSGKAALKKTKKS